MPAPPTGPTGSMLETEQDVVGTAIGVRSGHGTVASCATAPAMMHCGGWQKVGTVAQPVGRVWAGDGGRLSQGDVAALTAGGRRLISDDLRNRRRRVDAARDPDAEATPGQPPVQPAIRASRSRSAATVDPARSAAPVDDDESATRERWAESPIRRSQVRPDVQLADAAEQSGLVAAITDADGRLLWTSASRQMRRIADRVGFVPGGHWDERSVGTNAVGLALHIGQPATVFSSEHWSEFVQDWVCWCAPIRAPDGRLLGAIDLSGRWDRDSPLARLAVESLGKLVEAHLPADVLNPAVIEPGLTLRVLGQPEARLDGCSINLSPRQYEIACVLAINGPTTLATLRDLVYGARPVTDTTIKAEMSHLRRLLGGAIASKPYRLTTLSRVDAVDVLDLLRRGDVDTAAHLYRGPVLRTSEAPFVIDQRHVVDATLRLSLLATGSAAALLQYASIHPHDDAVLERVIELAAPGSAEHAEAEARLELGRRDDLAW